jgi:predicted O-methyltransferase YrrM
MRGPCATGYTRTARSRRRGKAWAVLDKSVVEADRLRPRRNLEPASAELLTVALRIARARTVVEIGTPKRLLGDLAR